MKNIFFFKKERKFILLKNIFENCNQPYKGNKKKNIWG